MLQALAPIALSLFGGLLGGSERPTLSAAQLEQMFGPQAIANTTNDLYKLLSHSPLYTQIMTSGAQRGTQLANATRANLAARGVSGTPLGGFLNAAGQGYGSAIQRQGQAGLYQNALQAALSNVASRQALFGQSYLGRQNMPTYGRMIGSSLLNAGAAGFSGLLKSKNTGGSSNPYDPNSGNGLLWDVLNNY